MVHLVWTFAFIANGVPNIQKMPVPDPMPIEQCRTAIEANAYRMHDWLRGFIHVPLSFPVAVTGECEPVQEDH